MSKHAFPADSRIAWFWDNDQEIFFDSEEAIGEKIEVLKKQGITHLITFSCTHFRWNFKPWWPQINECIGKIVRQAHKRGLKVIEHHSSELIYFPDTPELLNEFLEEFTKQKGYLKNYPGLIEYMTDKSQPFMQRVQTDAYGQPQRTAYNGFGHCFNNADYRKEYLEYLESIYALGVDGIMTDDVQYFGKSCFCKTCQKLFKAKYNVDMPLGDDFMKLQDDIRNPLFQKYIEFRAESMLNFHKLVAKHMTDKGLRLMRPNYISSSLSGGETPYVLDHLPQLDLVFQEACLPVIIRYCWPDNLAEQLHREMLGRQRNIRHMIMYYADRDDSLRFSWGVTRLAGALYTNTYDATTPPDETAIRDFEKKHLDYCFDNEPLKGVAFLDCRRSNLKAGSYLANRFFFWMESCFFGNVPAAMVSMSRPDEFGKYKVLCVNEVYMLSDKEIAELKNYAANGGTLVVTGRSGDMDENANMRSAEEYRKVWGFELLPPLNEVKVIAYGKGKIIRPGAGFGFPGTDKEKSHLFENFPPRFNRRSTYDLMPLRKHIHWVWTPRLPGRINSYVDKEANYAQHKAVFYQVADFLRNLLGDTLELKTEDFPELVLCRGYIKGDEQTADGMVFHILNAGNVFPEKVGQTLAHEDLIPFPDWSGRTGRIVVKLPASLAGGKFKASWHDLYKTTDLVSEIKGDKAAITVPFDLLKDYGMIKFEHIQSSWATN